MRRELEASSELTHRHQHNHQDNFDFVHFADIDAIGHVARYHSVLRSDRGQGYRVGY